MFQVTFGVWHANIHIAVYDISSRMYFYIGIVSARTVAVMSEYHTCV